MTSAKAGEVPGSAPCSASRCNSCCSLLAVDKTIEGVSNYWSLEQLTKFDILRLLVNLPEHLQSCW